MKETLTGLVTQTGQVVRLGLSAKTKAEGTQTRPTGAARGRSGRTANGWKAGAKLRMSACQPEVPRLPLISQGVKNIRCINRLHHLTSVKIALSHKCLSFFFALSL